MHDLAIIANDCPVYELAPDPPRESTREPTLLLSSIASAVGHWTTFAWYLDHRSNARLAGYGAFMAIVPSLPRLVVGDRAGAATFAALTAAAVAFGPMLDGDRRYPVATPIFSFVVAGAVAVTNIAYTPTFHF